MKRYGQRCPIARALDVIGERWTPLIIRELLLGPQRYTDLIDGLPGIGTNILASRLADLQACGVIEKHTLPRPTPVAVYELTEAGRALAPVLRELRSWGAQFGPPPEPNDVARPAWIIQGAASRDPGLKPGQTCELHVGDQSFELIGDQDRVSVKAGFASSPDALLTIEPSIFLRLAVGRIDASEAAEQSEIAGDLRAANNVLEMLAGSAP